jgi:WD40 repeat protein
MISIGLGILALVQRQDALKAQVEAVKQKEIATQQADEAKIQREKALENEKLATVQKDSAEIQRKLAEQQTIIAKNNLQEADKQRNIAQKNYVEAQEQQKRAEQNAQRAQEEKNRAEQASKDAERRRMLSIAQSMAVKSDQLSADTLLKGLLAYYAYNFNKDFDGVSYDPDIYKAIYSSVKLFKGDLFNVYKGHTSFVRTLLQVDNHLYSAGSDGQLIYWDIDSRSPQVLSSGLSIVKKVLVKDNLLYGVTDNRFFVYDLNSKTSDLYAIQPNEIKDFFVLSNDSLLVVYNQTINISSNYKVKGREVYKNNSRINAVKYNKQGNSIYVANLDGSIYFCENILTENPVMKLFATIPQANWGDIAYNSKRKILAAGLGSNEGTIYLWDVTKGQQTRVLRGHTAKISSITFSPDGNYMASSSFDGSVRLWNMSDLNTLPIVLNDHDNWATTVVFSNDSKYVYTGDKLGFIRKYPLNVENLTLDICNYLKRDLTVDEWKNYVGEDIEYKPYKCK